jgi:hypothetical protein
MINLILSNTKSFIVKEFSGTVFDLRSDLSENDFIAEIEELGFKRRVIPFLSVKQEGGPTNRWYNDSFQCVTIYAGGLYGLSIDEYQS